MKIQNMTAEHAESVIRMMRVFYASPAVWTDGSEEIFRRDVQNCVNDNPYLEGYVFTEKNETVGYAMLARAFPPNSESPASGSRIFT